MKSKKKLEVEACLDTILKKSKHFEKVQTGNKLNICYNCILTMFFFQMGNCFFYANILMLTTVTFDV